MNFHNQHPIPRRYLTAPPGAVTEKRLQELAATWDGVSGKLLLGPSGCGKTLTVARAGARVAKAHGDSWVQWIRADELSRMLSIRGSAEEIETLKSARVLIIDELGYERFPELCLEVIGARHDWERPTLVTCGLRLEGSGGFIERYSEATARRISEIGRGSIVNCWTPTREFERSGANA